MLVYMYSDWEGNAGLEVWTVLFIIEPASRQSSKARCHRAYSNRNIYVCGTIVTLMQPQFAS